MNEKVLSIIVKAKDEASKVMAEVDKHAEKFSDGMKKAGLVVGAAGVAVTAFAKNSNDYLREVVVASNRLARETGMTAEESSKLIAVTRRLGLQAEEASQLFGIFSKQITAARENAADAENPLNRLGIAVKNADGSARGFHTILLEVADRFKTMPAGAEKTALAMQLFGRSGKDLIGILNQGSQGILELEARAEKLGLTLTQGNIGAVSAYIDAQRNLKDSTDAIKMSVGTLTAPVLAQLSQRMYEVVQNFIQADGPMKTFTINALAFGGPVLTATGAMLGFLGALVQAGPALAGIIAFMANPITLLFAGAVTAVALAAMHLRGQLGSWAAVGNVVRDSMTQLWAIVGPHLTSAVNVLTGAISSNLWPALVRLWQQVQPVLIPALQILAAVLGSTLVAGIIGAINYLSAIINTISHFIHILNIAVAHVRGWANSVVNDFSSARNRIASTWASIYDALVSPIRAAGGTIGGVVDQIAHWINNITGKVNSFRNSVNSIRGEIGKLPGFSTGGFTGRGGANQIAGVVHKGEFVVPKRFVDQNTGTPMMGETRTYNIQAVNLNSPSAVDRFFDRIDAKKEMGAYGVGI